MKFHPYLYFIFLFVINKSVYGQKTDSLLLSDLRTFSTYRDILVNTESDISIPNVSKDNKYFTNTLLLKSLCEFKNGSYWTGYWDLKKVYNQSLEDISTSKSDTLSGLLVGIISTSINTIPQEYKWVMRFVGFPNLNYENAESLINNAKQSCNPFIEFEAFSLELFLEVYIKKEYDIQKVKAYHKKYSHLFEGKIVLSWIYDKIKAYQLNINTLNSFNKKEKDIYDYHDYLLGTAYFYTNQYSQSKKHFNDYLEISESDYIKTSKYRLFLISWLIEKESSKLLDQKRTDIIESGNKKLYLDKYANSFALSSPLPDKDLMYARILYDGKKYSPSDSILNEINVKDFSRKDKLEYNYRYARVKEALNDTTLAIKYYLNVIDYGGTKPKRYFTANAALHLGILYEGLNETDKAIFYYKKAYSYPKHSYKNSIDAEAKRRLKAL